MLVKLLLNCNTLHVSGPKSNLLLVTFGEMLHVTVTITLMSGDESISRHARKRQHMITWY